MWIAFTLTCTPGHCLRGSRIWTTFTAFTLHQTYHAESGKKKKESAKGMGIRHYEDIQFILISVLHFKLSNETSGLEVYFAQNQPNLFCYKLGNWFNPENVMTKIFCSPDLLRKWVRQSGNSTQRENIGPFPTDQTHFSLTYTIIMVIFKYLALEEQRCHHS